MSYKTDQLDGRVIEILRDGGVGFMPSDTIYGLSCRALDREAVERIYGLKNRDSDKPFILLISSISQLKELNINPKQTEAVKSYWPGAISLECDVSEAPVWLNRGKKHEAVRLPDSEVLRELIEEVGPIVSTSPNIQGSEPATSLKDAQDFFGERLDFYVDAGDLSDRQPSTLVRSLNGKLEVIRQGAVKIEPEREAE